MRGRWRECERLTVEDEGAGEWRGSVIAERRGGGDGMRGRVGGVNEMESVLGFEDGDGVGEEGRNPSPSLLPPASGATEIVAG